MEFPTQFFSYLSFWLRGVFVIIFLALTSPIFAETLIRVHISQQLLSMSDNGKIITQYPISSSRYGVGNKLGSNKTPLGLHCIVQKIGSHAPMGVVAPRTDPRTTLPPILVSRLTVLCRRAAQRLTAMAASHTSNSTGRRWRLLRRRTRRPIESTAVTAI